MKDNGRGFCAYCWFRKTAEDYKSCKDLKEGDCVITHKQCNGDWETYESASRCPVLVKFYNDVAIAQAKRLLGETTSKKQDKSPVEEKYEQLTLF